MSSQNSPENRDRTPKNNMGEPNFNWRGVIMFAFALMLIGLAFAVNKQVKYEKITSKRFDEILTDKSIAITGDKRFELVSNDGRENSAIIRGWYYPNVQDQRPDTAKPFELNVNLRYETDLKERITAAGYKMDQKEASTILAQALFSFLPIMILLLIVYLFFRQQIRMAGKGALSFGKSKARMLNRERNKVTFKDVAGVDEAKEEVQEIVEFLRDPKKFQKLGGRIPKGVLMVGPPGTGKTLLARGIAGEADVPFFSISGSDFVEMFVGVGASRVRDMFEQGRKAAPCLIFIDEIDAVGRHRGHGVGGGHDEREQTLNALLVEMDGFDTQEGVIIIAATNRPDVLDPALLRPGRFDRQITVPLPDVKGREQILRVHSRKVKMAEEVELSVIARGTPGYSGAELANVINEAALMAARKGAKSIGRRELEEARDKVRWGKERRSMAISEKEKENTAVHEAGHAILIELLENTDPLHKVTIIPRGPSLGSTMWLPAEDKYNRRKKELLDDLVVTMGGRVAEELVLSDVTSGAVGDIRMATSTARRMVCDWGMSEKVGMVGYGGGDEPVFMGRDMGNDRAYSEATAQMIDSEIKRLLDEAYQKAKDLISAHREKLDVITKSLLEYETLDGVQIREIMDHGRLINPPTSGTGGDGGGIEIAPHQDKSEPDVTPRTPPLDTSGLTGIPA